MCTLQTIMAMRAATTSTTTAAVMDGNEKHDDDQGDDDDDDHNDSKDTHNDRNHNQHKDKHLDDKHVNNTLRGHLLFFFVSPPPDAPPLPPASLRIAARRVGNSSLRAHALCAQELRMFDASPQLHAGSSPSRSLPIFSSICRLLIPAAFFMRMLFAEGQVWSFPDFPQRTGPSSAR